jgi:deoxyribodipyrimidine photolyase
VEYSTEYCKYQFSSEELRDIAETLAIKTQDLESAKDQAKSAAANFKDRIDKISLDVKSAARKYKDSYEMKDIECIVERDFVTGQVRYVRTDNGEIARTHTMTMGERQMHIDQAIKKTPLEQTLESDREIIRQQNIEREMSSETSAL